MRFTLMTFALAAKVLVTHAGAVILDTGAIEASSNSDKAEFISYIGANCDRDSGTTTLYSNDNNDCQGFRDNVHSFKLTMLASGCKCKCCLGAEV